MRTTVTTIIIVEPLWPDADCPPEYIVLPREFHLNRFTPAEEWAEHVRQVAFDMALHSEDQNNPDEMDKVTVEHHGTSVVWLYDGEELVGARTVDVTSLPIK